MAFGALGKKKRPLMGSSMPTFGGARKPIGGAAPKSLPPTGGPGMAMPKAAPRAAPAMPSTPPPAAPPPHTPASSSVGYTPPPAMATTAAPMATPMAVAPATETHTAKATASGGSYGFDVGGGAGGTTFARGGGEEPGGGYTTGKTAGGPPPGGYTIPDLGAAGGRTIPGAETSGGDDGPRREVAPDTTGLMMPQEYGGRTGMEDLAGEDPRGDMVSAGAEQAKAQYAAKLAAEGEAAQNATPGEAPPLSEEDQMWQDVLASHEEGWAAQQEGIQAGTANEQRRNAAINASMGRSVGGGFAGGAAQATLGGMQQMTQAGAQHEAGTRALMLDRMDRLRADRVRTEDKEWEGAIMGIDPTTGESVGNGSVAGPAAQAGFQAQIADALGEVSTGSEGAFIDNLMDLFGSSKEGQAEAAGYLDSYQEVKRSVDSAETDIAQIKVGNPANAYNPAINKLKNSGSEPDAAKARVLEEARDEAQAAYDLQIKAAKKALEEAKAALAAEKKRIQEAIEANKAGEEEEEE